MTIDDATTRYKHTGSRVPDILFAENTSTTKPKPLRVRPATSTTQLWPA